MRALRLVHPFPSALNAGLVLGLALLAGGGWPVSLVLALAMLLLQFSIGAANDYFDADLDARTKPGKPIPANLVGRRTAALVAAACAVGALLLAGALGWPSLLLAAAMLLCGLVYDALLKPTAWGWLCFAVAFPLLPVYAWWGATSHLPPRAELLLPLAALAGPALQLSNGLVDIDGDARGGISTLAVRLGTHKSLAAVALLLALIHGLAWYTLVLAQAAPASGALVGSASLLAIGGLLLLAATSAERRERGWQAQALSIALLALGWLAAVLVGPPGGS